MGIKLFTIGFTQKSARDFFSMLRDNGVKRVLDVRLNNGSQLAGFSKKDDLTYFLKEIGDIDYLHLTELTPTAEILNSYRGNKKNWPAYEKKFLELITRREI